MAYGKYRYSTIKGEKGTTWYVELWKDGFSGTSTEMTLSGEGFEITWNGSGGTRERVFLGSECVLNLMVLDDDDETDLYDILDSGFKKYFIRIYKNSVSAINIWWFGWVQPSFDTIENAPYPYISKITATDSYGYYEKQLFSTFTSDTEKEDNHSITSIYLDFIKNMQLASVNLVEYPLHSSKWDLLDGDTINSSTGVLTVDGTNGTRKPLSCEGDTFEVGKNYRVKIRLLSYTQGSLYLVDGGSGQVIGILNSSTSTTVTQYFDWTQTQASGGNGLHFYTSNNFKGTIKDISAYAIDELPAPVPVAASGIVKSALNWHTITDSLHTTDDGLKYFICKGAFANNTNFPFEYKEFDAFKESLKIFNTVGFLAEGSYYFIQPNHYIGNTTGSNSFHKYTNTTSPRTDIPLATSETHLCEINQSTNVLLGGSSFTYEAPFKSVSAIYSGGSFTLPPGTDIRDDGTSASLKYTGQMIAGQTYTLDCFLQHSEKTPTSNLNVSSGAWMINSNNQSFHYAVTIKATSSAGDKYLSLDSNGDLEWVTGLKKIVFKRGIHMGATLTSSMVYNNDFNNDTVIGSVTNGGSSEGSPSTLIPYQVFSSTSGDVEFIGRLKFSTPLPQLSDTSEIYIKCGCTMTKRQSLIGQTYQVINYSSGSSSLVTTQTTVGEISLEVEEATSLTSNEQKFTETNASSTAIENYELSSVVVGINQSDTTFGLTDVDKNSITDLFERGTDVAGAENLTRLLTKEFLELQQSPLQILQGSIQSANISPIDIVKYKLNSDDTNAKYYMFLGGTFKASSEIMDGEWFRIKGD